MSDRRWVCTLHGGYPCVVFVIRYVGASVIKRNDGYLVNADDCDFLGVSAACLRIPVPFPVSCSRAVCCLFRLSVLLRLHEP